ncbi:hypothetical protein DL765_009267 [Monosporascus sp. GIB2]|nr:hypothetical protein DL765_009267 [Monosporascus sp. GIB2]
MKVPVFSSPAAALAGVTASPINDAKSVARRASREISPDDLSIVETLDKELSDSRIRGTMHGISFVIKDNVHSDEKHNTYQGPGCLLRAMLRSRRRRTTAAINFSDDYSTRAGQIRNPLDPTQGCRTAVAVPPRPCAAAKPPSRWHQDPWAPGSPASHVGLHALKSSPAQVTPQCGPRELLQRPPGPMARSMKDVALRLDIMAGPEQYENLMWNWPGHYPQDGYSVRITNDDSLNGMKLGLP